MIQDLPHSHSTSGVGALVLRIWLVLLDELSARDIPGRISLMAEDNVSPSLLWLEMWQRRNRVAHYMPPKSKWVMILMAGIHSKIVKGCSLVTAARCFLMVDIRGAALLFIMRPLLLLEEVAVRQCPAFDTDPDYLSMPLIGFVPGR